jgi:hypothetical protein
MGVVERGSVLAVAARSRAVGVKPLFAPLRLTAQDLRRTDLRPVLVFVTLVLAMLGGALFDGIDPNRAALLPLVVGPLAAALLLPVRATAAISALCVFLALVLPQAFLTDAGPQILRFSALVALSVLAIMSARWRQRLDETRIRLAVSGAQASDARRRAVELNDGVYQNLFAARMWSRMGDPDAASASIDEALAATSSLLSELLQQGSISPGSLVKREDLVDDAQGVIDLRLPDTES